MKLNKITFSKPKTVECQINLSLEIYVNDKLYNIYFVRNSEGWEILDIFDLNDNNNFLAPQEEIGTIETAFISWLTAPVDAKKDPQYSNMDHLVDQYKGWNI